MGAFLRTHFRLGKPPRTRLGRLVFSALFAVWMFLFLLVFDGTVDAWQGPVLGGVAMLVLFELGAWWDRVDGNAWWRRLRNQPGPGA